MQASFNRIWMNKNYRYATIIALLMLVWLGSGLVSGEKAEKTKAQQPQKESLTQVRAKYIEAQEFPLHVLVKGKTESDRYVDVKAEVTGQVDKISIEKGQLVKKGDVICRLAVEDRELRLEEAESNVEQAQIEYDGALRLKTGGYQSKTAIASAKSKLDTAKAILLRRKIDLEKTSIRAPFDGVLDQRPAEVGALMRPGDMCATILDLDPLVVSGQVSEADVIRIPEGSLADIRLVTGEVLTGKIRYISRSANEMTRTYRIEISVNNPEMRLFSGVTADIAIYTRSVSAHLIPASLLMLADDGQLGVRVLDENHQVVFYDVNVVGDEAEGIWVTGLPLSTLLITVGQEYVGEGEKVDVTFVEDIVSETNKEELVEKVKDAPQPPKVDSASVVLDPPSVVTNSAEKKEIIDSAEELDQLKKQLMESAAGDQLKTVQENIKQAKSDLTIEK